MIRVTSKEKRREGMSISELFIVLGVTIVLSAILMPAIASTNSDRAETILSAAAVPVFFNGSTQPAIQARQTLRRDNRRDRSTTRAASPKHGAIVQEAIKEARALVGTKKLLTTDIRSRVP